LEAKTIPCLYAALSAWTTHTAINELKPRANIEELHTSF
jgi:hypothetical protein